MKNKFIIAYKRIMGDIAKLSKSDNELKEEKRVRKKIIALCLAGVMAVMPIAGMGGTMTYAENTNAVGNSSPSVSTMKLNLLEKPLGVDKENLSFSWAMEDGDMDEYQTAYQIVVGTTEAAIRKGEFLCDTGWVTSAQSSGCKSGFRR